MHTGHSLLPHGVVQPFKASSHTPGQSHKARTKLPKVKDTRKNFFQANYLGYAARTKTQAGWENSPRFSLLN
ncbi:unnamed protein product [Prunus armeniaca]